ncbi:MAG: hypothetical protein PVG30_02445 [Gammaproteobacteria bacterium]|jgi:hypothetical protein
MVVEYKDYRKRFKEDVIDDLKIGLKKIGILQNANKDENRIKELEIAFKEAKKEVEEYGHDYDCEKVKCIKQDLDKAKQNAENNVISIEHIVKFFEKVDKWLEKDFSIEELKEVEKKVRKFKKSKESEYKKYAAALALVRRSCRKTLNYINCMKMRKKWKQVSMSSGPAYIFDFKNPFEVVRTGNLAFLIPFLGGKESLMVRQIEDKNGRKSFEFDRNFFTRIKGVNLYTVVDQFCDYFEKEINKGCYMQFNFRDKKDLFNICEELVKRNVRLNLKKTDLPEIDKYKLVGLYIKQLKNEERKQNGVMVKGFAKNDKDEDFISKGEFVKRCAKVEITPKLQKYVWKNHGVRISGSTELTFDQKEKDLPNPTTQVIKNVSV